MSFTFISLVGFHAAMTVKLHTCKISVMHQYWDNNRALQRLTAVMLSIRGVVNVDGNDKWKSNDLQKDLRYLEKLQMLFPTYKILS